MRGPSKKLQKGSRLWQVFPWLLIVPGLAWLVFWLVVFVSPNFVGVQDVSRRTNAGVPIDPASTDTSYEIALAPGSTRALAPEPELAVLEPATLPVDEVLQPAGSRKAWLEPETGVSAAGALDCVIDPYQIIDVGSGVTGVIKAVYVERSDEVKAGDKLVELDSGVERAAVEVARARAKMDGEIKAREANLDLGKHRRRRANNLFEQDALSLDLREEVDTEAIIARNELQSAREKQMLATLQLVQAQEALKRRSIHSPVDGVVIERLMSPGERVDEEPILTIAQIDPLRVEVILPSALFGSVKPKMSATVQPEFGDEVYVAAVTIIDRIIDSASGTFGVQLELPNPDHSIPAGLHCRVRFLED